MKREQTQHVINLCVIFRWHPLNDRLMLLWFLLLQTEISQNIRLDTRTEKNHEIVGDRSLKNMHSMDSLCG